MRITKEIRKTVKMLTGGRKKNEYVLSSCDKNSLINDKVLIAELFNKHFTSVADRVRSSLPDVTCDLSKLKDFLRSKRHRC